MLRKRLTTQPSKITAGGVENWLLAAVYIIACFPMVPNLGHHELFAPVTLPEDSPRSCIGRSWSTETLSHEVRVLSFTTSVESAHSKPRTSAQLAHQAINLTRSEAKNQYSMIAVALSRHPNIPAPPPDTAFLCHSMLISARAPVMWIWCALFTRACHVFLVNALDFSGICRQNIHRWIQSERKQRPTPEKCEENGQKSKGRASPK